MFYTFRQNNSGGWFQVDDNVTTYVIVEADTPEQAECIAESHGIYFNGVDYGIDCECCGDRWSTIYCDGTETPVIYDKSPEDVSDHWSSPDRWVAEGEPYCHVYYKNGEKKTYRREPNFTEVKMIGYEA